MESFHIAELNIARAQYDLDDPRMADFMNNLDRVNALAERSPGFVWRLQSDSGNATDITVMNDPRIVANLSVWETLDALEHFVFNTVHKKIYDRRGEWFPKMREASFVMWKIAPGCVPTLDEALARLEKLRREGPGKDVFGWEGLPNLKLWTRRKCA